jgi:hypothetical protein
MDISQIWSTIEVGAGKNDALRLPSLLLSRTVETAASIRYLSVLWDRVWL